MNEILKMIIKSALESTLEVSFECLAITMAEKVAIMVDLPEKREDFEKYFKKIFKKELEEIYIEFDKTAKRISKETQWVGDMANEEFGKLIEKMKTDRIDEVTDEAAGNDPDKGEGPDNEN